MWRSSVRRSHVDAGDGTRLNMRLMLISIGLLVGGIGLSGGILGLLVVIVLRPGGNEMLVAWMGTLFGFIGGGFGALFVSWNAYRQIEGSGDIWQSTRMTVLDYAVVAWAVLGMVCLGWGLFASQSDQKLRWGLAIFGGILLFQCIVIGLPR